MFKTALFVLAQAIALPLLANVAEAAPTPADSVLLQPLEQTRDMTAEDSFETASYCTWVLTFEEGTTETPTWCEDELADEG